MFIPSSNTNGKYKIVAYCPNCNKANNIFTDDINEKTNFFLRNYVFHQCRFCAQRRNKWTQSAKK